MNKGVYSKEIKGNKYKIYKINQDFYLFLVFYKMSNQTLEVVRLIKILSISANIIFLKVNIYDSTENCQIR